MNQLIMILLISILVLVHEAGHFVAARIFNVRVTRFGIGMPIGPSWRLFKWKNTVFYIHAFLFGGYVSFAEPKPEINEKDDKKQELDDEEYLDKDSPELYENKTIGQKLIIVTAGVIMNVVFAIFLVMMCALIFHKLPSNSQNIYVASFSDKVTSNAQARGILPKDKILSVNNQKINTLYQLSFFAQNSKLFDNYAQESLYSENLKELKKLNSKIKNENEIIPQNIKINLPKTKTENPLNVNENVLKGLEKYKKDGIELNKTQIELRNEIYKQKDYVSKGNVTLKDIALSLSDTYKPVSIKVLRNNKEIEIKNVFVDKSGLFGMLLNVEEVYTQTKTNSFKIS